MIVARVTTEEFGHILRSLSSAWVKNNYTTYASTRKRILGRARALLPRTVTPQKYQRLVQAQTYRQRRGLPLLALDQYIIRYPG